MGQDVIPKEHVSALVQAYQIARESSCDTDSSSCRSCGYPAVRWATVGAFRPFGCCATCEASVPYGDARPVEYRDFSQRKAIEILMAIVKGEP